MHIVTGAAGFIGSNMVAHLNKNNIRDIVCVDTLSSNKVANLAGLEFMDFISPSELLNMNLSDCTLWHFGANSKTSSSDWDSIYQSNVAYTRELAENCDDIVFASSASVYGDNTSNKESSENEAPKNMYAATKMICDNMLINYMETSKIQSWRFFNVYGNRESHKVSAQQASPYTNFKYQAQVNGFIELFDNSHNVLRDFICVDDVVKIMYDTHAQDVSFISNLGTGSTYSFHQWGELIADKYNASIKYIEVPNELRNIYQMYTCSDNNSLLDRIGDYKFITPEQFVEDNL